ncbi:DUF1758 domain-containing protein [Trichonephila clavata]|uniref:DUF1758 domain-containing protein n=1 Tax=Trichonephila clavata TaxID=2740835 RepID=A0A8X6LT00_TRICU|nr:DUF1758 domain-containing protein [Trichonephila clavata]
MDTSEIKIPSNIDLADNDFGIPGEIDLLIGCELFFELLRPNQLRSPCEKWLLQETVFGYIVVGSSDKFEEKSYCGLAINSEINSDSLNQQLRAFWEIETVDESSKEYSLEEETSETQYQNTHYRNEEGRYVVQLPFKKDPNCLDDLLKCSNNYTKLLHILSYIFRFIKNCRNPSVKRSGKLHYSEVNEAELWLIKNLQTSAFKEEIDAL